MPPSPKPDRATQPQDAQAAFRAFEHAGWEAAAARYESAFADATRPYLGALLEAVRAAPGMRALDVACGTGAGAAAAHERGLDAAGVDFSPAMIAEARRLHPGIEFRLADADALPFPDVSFDAVIVNFGAHHFPAPARALGEARRVLRPGGRVAFTVWAKGANAAFKIVLAAVTAHGDGAGKYPAPPDGDLTTEADCLDLLRRAGFAADRCRAELVAAAWPLARAEDLLERFLAGTVRTAKLIAAQPDHARQRIAAAAAEAVARFRRGDHFAVPTAAILAVGRNA